MSKLNLKIHFLLFVVMTLWNKDEGLSLFEVLSFTNSVISYYNNEHDNTLSHSLHLLNF